MRLESVAPGGLADAVLDVDTAAESPARTSVFADHEEATAFLLAARDVPQVWKAARWL